ncbi:MAG TPA: hypothetical protein VIV40_02860 [Kofleriaceae bacterium]
MKVWLMLLVAACKFEHGAGGDAGVSDVVDAEIDAMPDAPDPNCFGKTPFLVCLQTLPTVSFTMPMAVNTSSTGMSSCPVLGGEVKTVGGVESCVIAGVDITIDAANVGVFGARPLVVVATGTISISSPSFDITSRSAMPASDGPNANPPQCSTDASRDGTSATGGGGGGAGGSFGGKGSNGGGGAGAATSGGVAASLDPSFNMLRGGCRGGTGGAGQSTTATGGSGGGAVYIASQTAINITGSINASGAGGFGGQGPRGGGGGGGSGGMIVLYAPTLTVGAAARIFANGGGGGGGAGNSTNDGSPGSDAIAPDTAAPGGIAGDIQGTAGGSGAFKSVPAGVVAGAAQGGGGGGGGVGVIRILSGQSVPAINVSPAPILN